jgi:hypothetical protein
LDDYSLYLFFEFFKELCWDQESPFALFDCLSYEPNSEKVDIYVEELLISPILINLTFKTLNYPQENRPNDFFNVLLQNMGVIIANIDQCPLELTGIRIFKYYDTFNQIRSNFFIRNFVQKLLTTSLSASFQNRWVY